jgi:hypothetical protein
MGASSTIPKTLQKIAAQVSGAKVVVLKYHHKNVSTYGFCIVDAEQNELMVFEPTFNVIDDKWKITNRCTGETIYRRSINGVEYDKIKAGWTGYKLSEKKTHYI